MTKRPSWTSAAVITAGIFFTNSALALGPWMTGSAQGSFDAPAVAARESMTATSVGVGYLASFGRDAAPGPYQSPGPPYQCINFPQYNNTVIFGWETPSGYVGNQCIYGAFAQNPLTAVSWGYNSTHVFYSRQGSSGVDNLMTRRWDGSVWSAPTDLGGGIRAHGRNVVAVSSGPGHMAVFHRAQNNKLYAFYYDGIQATWSSEQGLGGDLRGPPVVVTPAPGKYVVCANNDVGNYDFDCRIFQNGSWSDWIKLQPGGVASYHLVSALPGTATVIASKQTSTNVYHFYTRTWDGVAWGPWINTGLSSNGVRILDSTSWGGGRIDFVFRLDGQYSYTPPLGSSAVYDYPSRLQHAWFDGYFWQSAVLPPTDLALGARIVTWGPGRLDVFYDRAIHKPAGPTWNAHFALAGAGHIYATD